VKVRPVVQRQGDRLAMAGAKSSQRVFVPGQEIRTAQNIQPDPVKKHVNGIGVSFRVQVTRKIGVSFEVFPAGKTARLRCRQPLYDAGSPLKQPEGRVSFCAGIRKRIQPPGETQHEISG